MIIKITKDVPLHEIISMHPSTATVMIKYGLYSSSFADAPWATISHAAVTHRMSARDMNNLIDELNEIISKRKR
ncbi:DUF1858 domain-containing protein [Candidatus Woesearchaeota archaeon]|nr:MAG: DUF1858 domain-containing protein [Candidatus Woesearchaeota archaeon]